MAKMITDPIVKVSKSVEKIGQLDFSADETLDSLSKRKDENGVMARSISKLQTALVDVVVTLKDQAENIRHASETLEEGTAETTTTIEQVEVAVTEIADGATSQAGETQKATENVITMGNLVEENGEELQKLIENARAMRTSSEEAAATLQTLEEINRSAVDSIVIIAEQTNTTNESAQKIREATDLITSIAEETNLLSLNASIEAARAGEQGRGFAVVASQIQKLAEQSNESAHQIEAVIDTLIADSQKAVETMGQVETIMNKQNENVAQTEKEFSKVAAGIATSVDSIRIIRDKSEKLDETRIAVVDIVQNLTAIAEENAASTEETSASVTEVTAIVAEISEKATELKNGSLMYPVHFSESNTSGEKGYEEFFTDTETVDMCRLNSLGIITNKEIPNKDNLAQLLDELSNAFDRDELCKEDVVEIIKNYLPNFAHIETGKGLDSKM